MDAENIASTFVIVDLDFIVSSILGLSSLFGFKGIKYHLD